MADVGNSWVVREVDRLATSCFNGIPADEDAEFSMFTSGEGGNGESIEDESLPSSSSPRTLSGTLSFPDPDASPSVCMSEKFILNLSALQTNIG